MATQLQLRRGNTTHNNSFTGAEGELTVDTTKHNLRIHDGTTQGGYTINNASEVVHITDTETITGNKTLNGTTTIKNLYLSPEDSNLEGGQIIFQGATNEPNASKNLWLDRYNGQFRFIGTDSSNNIKTPLRVDIENNKVYGITPAAGTNNTQVATTEFVTTAISNNLSSILSTIYPVNSIYIGTQSVCPMIALITNSQWTLVASKIVINVDNSAAIKGSIGTSSASSNGKYFVAQDTSFSQNTLPNLGGYSIDVAANQTIPGASATVSSTTLTVNLWKRTA